MNNLGLLNKRTPYPFLKLSNNCFTEATQRTQIAAIGQPDSQFAPFKPTFAIVVCAASVCFCDAMLDQMPLNGIFVYK